MKGYKAFEKGLICKGKQYAENTVFEEENAVICQSGMHFCKNPLDCLDHYPLIDKNGELTEFADVEALDETKTDNGKKFCTTKLKVGKKLTLKEFVKESISFVGQECKTETPAEISDEDSAQLASSGYSAKLASSGNYAQLASSGYSAKLASSGDSAAINSTGKYAVICCAGHESVAKGKIGSWITLSEWEFSDEENTCIPVCVKTERIDGKRIKEDTYYTLKNGEFVEVK